MYAANRDQTFQDGICRKCAFQTIHGRTESNKVRSVIWMLEPAPHNFFGIVGFVKGCLVWLVGMSEIRVKKNFGKPTGALETFVAAIEMQFNTMIRISREYPISNPY